MVQVLKDNKVYIIATKCEFDKAEVENLDHRIIVEGIQMMNEKIKMTNTLFEKLSKIHTFLS